MWNFITLMYFLFLVFLFNKNILVNSYLSKISIRSNKFMHIKTKIAEINICNRIVCTTLNNDNAETNSVNVKTVLKCKKVKSVPKFDLRSSTETNKNETYNIFGEEITVKYDLSLTVYGEPIPLSRHMVARGRMYNPSAKAQNLFANACADKLPITPMDGPIEANLIFYFSRPKNHYGTGKNSNKLKDNIDTWHSKKKDLDNLIKFVLDSLNGKAYLDDSQICIINSAKLYTNSNPRIEVRMRKLSPMKLQT